MKKFSKLKISILLLFFFGFSNCLAFQIDSSNIIEENLDDKGFDMIIKGGFGMTIGSPDYWENIFYNGPAMGIGVELPFTKSHNFAIELYQHYWISKVKPGQAPNRYIPEFIKINDDLYSQWGLSAVVKAYLGNNNSIFKVGVHLGWLVLSPNNNYKGPEIGIELFFFLNQSYHISLSRRIFLGKINLAGGSNIFPNLLTINFNYKFKLVL